ncbi:MAG: beta-phosphoglucomutase family hydrolase [Myxococcota bacterium]|nr:beta-phosphoglucomutase family hydrolase [Myxococcota bacterium]
MDTPALTKDRFDAVLFDLDGVLTDTAAIHAACWKQTFDGFLKARAERSGEPFRAFEGDDYAKYVDGKPRYDGVRDFLASRGIELPEGDPADPPDHETVCGVGNRKNQLVGEAIARGEVERYESSVELVLRLREAGIRTAVVSSSANCAAVLKAANMTDLFEERVDGTVIRELGLRGKPEPDSFLEGARRLGVEPGRAVVVEDAISGVQAGSKGDFGLVVGVARKDDADALAENGAHVVVTDLSELRA